MLDKRGDHLMARKTPLYCSFCRKDDATVEKLIGGPGSTSATPASRCATASSRQAAPPFPGWTRSPTPTCCALRPGRRRSTPSRDVLQEHVDILRRPRVSWERIGDAMGVSRQAAWERFS